MDSDPALAKLLNQQQALADFGSFAFRTDDLQAILDWAAKACATSLNARFCKVCRYRPEADDLVIAAGYGWQPGVVGLATSDMVSPGGVAYRTRKSVIYEDVADTHHVLPDYYRQHGIVSAVNVVIAGLNGDIPFGILEIDTDERRIFDQHDITFLTGFANVLAEAVATNRRMGDLRTALAEKDVLARELQHRVRNNLQLILSMLTMEASSHTDPQHNAFRDIANRVNALATVYDYLLGTGMSRTLELDEYLTKLCATLREFQPSAVELVQSSSGPVRVNLDTATSVGIAITEIITNAYKHAFPKGSGKIEVLLELRTVPVIQVRDDGIGMDAPVSKRHGLGLVQRMVEQMDGKFRIQRSPTGTQCEIVLPESVMN